MKKITSTVVLSTLLATLSFNALADRVEVKGTGIYQYDGKFLASDKPSDAEKQAAMLQAKRSAWKNFVAKQNSSQQQMIARNEQALLDNLDSFITDAVILDVARDANLRTLTVVARVAFNDEAVSQFLQRSSVGPGAQGARSNDSLFSFLFMARKQTSIKQFDERRTEVQKTTTARTKAADGAVTQEYMDQSGGNTLRKEDVVSYAVSSNQDLDAAMGETISAAGIEYVGYDDIVTNCKAPLAKSFQNEFVSADEMSPKTRSAVIAALRSCDVRYFATGTVDSGVASRDPVSGNQQVFVSVRSQLWDVSQKLPRKVGSVGPKQYSGLGPDQGVASKNALALAAKDLAKSLVDQLNAKGIR